ncbi:MAG: hypothetical protein ACR2RA_19640 [Geminicoccaceae bacterium]
MMLIIAVLMQMLALTAGPLPAAAESASSPADLQFDAALDPTGSSDLIDAIISMAPVRLDDGPIDPADGTAALSSSSGDDEDWATGASSGVAYPVTSNLSVGLLYQLEEIEDLTAELIEMGTAGVDYTSHKVLVRANWSFDFDPNLF